MNTLTVYRASAGSGKTFTLAVQYITLLVENPQAYRHTLAVTFTNKATEEMKMRILSQLYGISVGLNESKPYLECVKQLSGLDEKTIITNAAYALRELIHHYSYFRVETIDAFFQTVLRNLARELELTANLRIELNDEQVEQQAVDQLIEDLNDSSLLLSWILDYIQENIDDDKSWNVIAQIKQFGRNILKDYYKKNRQKIKEVFEEKDFFKQYTGQLRAISKHAEEQMKACGDAFFKCIADNGFDITDFSKGASGVCGYFLKLQSGDFTDDERVFNSTAQGASENPEKWVVKKKAIVGEPIYDLVCSTLQEMLITTERKRKQQSRLFKSVSLTLKHINQLRLLDSIGDKVEKLNLELNRFMLSDTQTLLKSMIGENDSPFIFEKIGAQLHNIMIDEFQDTGSVQWENFKVLLLETMSHDSNNLIVGDVKQSIYRWRSGDWRLLNDIEEQFKEHEITIKPLQVNRRSERNIITFNNTFFQEAVRQEYEQLKQDIGDEAELLQKAYADVTQEIPSDKKEVGIVEVELLPNTPEYEEETHKKIADKVQHLLDNGVRENDIAIIVRYNSDIERIGEYFMKNKPEVHLISEEAFHLDASQAVNIIINAMKVLNNPNDDIAQAALTKLYIKAIKDNNLTDNNILLKDKSLKDYLPPQFFNQENHLRGLSLIDMAEEIFRIFELQKLSGQTAYICAFYDKLNEYMQDGIPDLHGFLEQWTDNIHKCSIQSSSKKGISLYTIHKSKGLEFDHVIVPFCNWELEKRDVIWCEPDVEPFNALPIVPVSFSRKQMKNSIYEKDYAHEHFLNIVDNLNLLYVTFTRAGRGLYVYGKRGDKGQGRSWVIENSLGAVANQLNAEYNATKEKDEEILFTYGNESSLVNNRVKKATKNIFEQTAEDIEIEIDNYENIVEFKQSNKSKEFVSDDNASDEESTKRQSYIKLGSVLHAVFSTIKTKDDVSKALNGLEAEGILYDKIITQDRLHKLITDRLNDPRVASWYSDRWTLFNECSILKLNTLTDKVEERRPDRVMFDGNEMIVVDYKFGVPKEEHQSQVKEYMNLLSEMGYKNITGYLWYLFSNKMIKL